MQSEQGEPEKEAMDRDDASDHNSDFFHEKTFANRAEGEAMGKRISAFKRNRSDRGSFKTRDQVSEARGDQDEVDEEQEDESENETPRKGSKNSDSSDFENVKRGAGKHRVRKSKNEENWETEP